MEKIKWTKKLTNEEFLERTGEKRMFINDIPRREANWIAHIVRRKYLDL